MPEAPTWYEGHYKYVFSGWNEFMVGISVDGDMTFNADYTGGYRDYTVTFYLNGGVLTGGSAEQEVTYGQSAAAPTVKRDGYIFIGWTDSMSYHEVTGDTTVNAIWLKTEPMGETDPPVDNKGCKSSANLLLTLLAPIALLALKLRKPPIK
jgi:hypothetical protein